MENNTKKKVEQPTLIIKDNILKYKNSVIQISNIAHCEIAPEPKKSYLPCIFVGFIIGIAMLFFESLIIWGFVILALCGIIFIVICNENADPNMYFILELNSGSLILFSSRDKDFLWKAENEIINCFNDKREGIIINFSDCTITHSQIGEDNIMNNEEQNGD